MTRPLLLRTLVQRAAAGNKGALRLLARRVLPLISARVRQWTRHRATVDDIELDRMVDAIWLAVLHDPRLPTARALEEVVLAVCDTYLGARLAEAEARAARPAHDPELDALRVHLEARLDATRLLAFRLLYTDRLSIEATARLLDTDAGQVRAWQTEIRAEAARWTVHPDGE